MAITENLVLYQDTIPKLIIFLIIITCLLDSVLKLEGEFICWSLLEVKGLSNFLEKRKAVCFPNEKGNQVGTFSVLAASSNSPSLPSRNR